MRCDPQEAGKGGQAGGAEHALCPGPKLGSELGCRPHGQNDPTRRCSRRLRGSGGRRGPQESAALDDGARAASLEVEDSGPAGHLGHRHQYERRTPGRPRGDAVEGAEPGDRSLPAVSHPQGEAHPGSDAEYPQDRRHQPCLGEGGGPVSRTVVKSPAPAPNEAPTAANPTMSTRSLPAVGIAWRNWVATKTVATNGKTRRARVTLCPRIWRITRAMRAMFMR